jgi:hypothetical protein
LLKKGVLFAIYDSFHKLFCVGSVKDRLHHEITSTMVAICTKFFVLMTVVVSTVARLNENEVRLPCNLVFLFMQTVGKSFELTSIAIVS